MKVLISGSSGLIGAALSESLCGDGHEVAGLPRTYEASIDFSGVDAVIHLAGENIASGRWTADKKQRIETSRIKGTQQLVEQLVSGQHRPKVFICASAVGFYGNSGEALMDESGGSGSGFLAEVCRKWEAESAPAEAAKIRTLRVRFGMVLSSNGGALKKMLPPFKAGLGGRIGSGQQYMSWIALDDAVQAIRFLLEHEEISGAVNLTAPNPVTNREFSGILAGVLKRPAVCSVPAFAARLLFGEMADELLLSGCRAVPRKLHDAGYRFRCADLRSALNAVLKKA